MRIIEELWNLDTHINDGGLGPVLHTSTLQTFSATSHSPTPKSLLYTVETYPVTVVIGQTGSGKTTQLPQFLEQAGWCNDGKVIAVTQVGESRGLSQHHSR